MDIKLLESMVEKSELLPALVVGLLSQRDTSSVSHSNVPQEVKHPYNPALLPLTSPSHLLNRGQIYADNSLYRHIFYPSFRNNPHS